MQRAALMIAIISTALVLGSRPTAANYCAQPRGSAGAHAECMFNTLHECRASLKAKGGGHCYRFAPARHRASPPEYR